MSFSTSKQNKTRLNYNCSWINNGTKHKWIITVPIKISVLITDVDVNVVSLEWSYGTFGDNQDFKFHYDCTGTVASVAGRLGQQE